MSRRVRMNEKLSKSYERHLRQKWLTAFIWHFSILLAGCVSWTQLFVDWAESAVKPQSINLCLLCKLSDVFVKLAFFSVLVEEKRIVDCSLYCYYYWKFKLMLQNKRQWNFAFFSAYMSEQIPNDSLLRHLCSQNLHSSSSTSSSSG